MAPSLAPELPDGFAGTPFGEVPGSAFPFRSKINASPIKANGTSNATKA